MEISLNPYHATTKPGVGACNTSEFSGENFPGLFIFFFILEISLNSHYTATYGSRSLGLAR